MPSIAPTVDMNGPNSEPTPTIQIVKGGPSVLIGADATVVDPDSTDFDGGLLNMFVTNSSMGDQLVILGQGSGPGQIGVNGNIVTYGGVHIATITYPSTGTGPSIPTPGTLYLTLHSAATPVSIQALLQRVAYQATASSFGTEDRYASVQLRDGDGGESGSAGTIIRMSSINASPTVTTGSTPTSFVEAGANATPSPVIVDPHLTVNDADSNHLASATIQIGSGFVAGQDVLDLPGANFWGLTSDYNAATGTLVLTATNGSATLTNWNQALSSVRYVNLADEPSGGSRAISFIVNDGAANSNASVKQITIVTSEDPSVLDLNGVSDGAHSNLDYVEQSVPTLISPAATLSDPDTANYAGGRLTIAVLNGNSDDTILITNQGTGNGQIGLSGTSVLFGGVVIGTFTGSGGSAPLVVSLNSAATVSAVQALVRAISYFNNSDSPRPSALLQLTVTDSAGNSSSAVQAAVNIIRVDDPLILDLNGAMDGQSGAIFYGPGTLFTALAPSGLLIDDDSENFAGGSLQLRLIGGQSGDVVAILDQSGGSISVTDDNTVTWVGIKIGTVYPLQGRIIFDVQSLPAAAIQDLIRAIGFSNANAEPGSPPRTIEFHLISRPGGSPLVETVSVTVGMRDAANDFNGDGRSDILWRHDSGLLTEWLGQANGGFVDNGANAFNNIASSWSVTGTGDFNGDGRDDILWRHTSGLLTEWLGQANGGFIDNGANAFANVASSWSVAGTGDFNGDGRDDILWRHDSGLLTEWLGTATGGFTDNGANAFHNIASSWSVTGTGDFNGDGRDDILWRHESGFLTEWLGTATGGFNDNGVNAFHNIASSWSVTGVGDFNGDGRDDILWRHETGLLTSWLGQANGGFVDNGANAFNNIATSWSVTSIGDFNGDGRDDILWRHESGLLTEWLGTANGGFADNGANAFHNIASSWQVQPEDPFI